MKKIRLLAQFEATEKAMTKLPPSRRFESGPFSSHLGQSIATPQPQLAVRTEVPGRLAEPALARQQNTSAQMQ